MIGVSGDILRFQNRMMDEHAAPLGEERVPLTIEIESVPVAAPAPRNGNGRQYVQMSKRASKLPPISQALIRVAYIAYGGAVWYYRSRSFILAHIGGPGGGMNEVKARKVACDACRYKQVKDGEDYCGACGCGYRRLARLKWKRWLALWKCPVGAYSYGGLFARLKWGTRYA